MGTARKGLHRGRSTVSLSIPRKRVRWIVGVQGFNQGRGRGHIMVGGTSSDGPRRLYTGGSSTPQPSSFDMSRRPRTSPGPEGGRRLAMEPLLPGCWDVEGCLPVAVDAPRGCGDTSRVPSVELLTMLSTCPGAAEGSKAKGGGGRRPASLHSLSSWRYRAYCCLAKYSLTPHGVPSPP